jgi:hypothetical protein
MISPVNQYIIQIEVTNVCSRTCSNCTRFCGHHTKPFVMDFETYKKAVDSLVNYPGIVGMMGGEPTLIPDFEKYVEYLASKITLKQRRGLWSSLGDHYYKYYELIKDVFGYECLNDHKSKSLHQPLLIASKELPIDEETRKKLIDKCWIQTLWSSSITPKGCFFCEVAAALDMLFDGPGGWPITNNWFMKIPRDFTEQMKWCDFCGGAMPFNRRDANDRIDDVSPGNLQKLLDCGSPKALSGRVKVFDVASYDLNAAKAAWQPDREWYLQGPRITSADELKPKKIEAVIVCVDYDDYLSITLPRHAQMFDELIVITSSKDQNTQTLCSSLGVKCLVTDLFYDNNDIFNKGKAINAGLQMLSLDDWVLFFDADVLLPKNFRSLINQQELNPGNLYYTGRVNAKNDKNQITAYLDNDSIPNNWIIKGNEYFDQAPHGYFQFVNQKASIIKTLGKKWYPEIFNNAGDCDLQFSKIWPEQKQTLLPQPQFTVVHLPHDSSIHTRGTNWFGRKSPRFSFH